MLLALGVLAACRRNVDPVSQGRAYFIGYGCNSCHRVGNSGGAYGPDLTYMGFRATREWLNLYLKDPRAWKSNTPMPNFHLTDQARSRIADYLFSLKGRDFSATGKPWDRKDILGDPVKRGGVIYERVGCASCHGRDGKGGYPNNNVTGGQIPALIRTAEGYSKEEVVARIRNGKKSDKADLNGPDPMVLMPGWGEVLTSDEIDALVAYLYSLKPYAAPGERW